MEKNHTQNNKRWRENNPEKVKAHSIVNEAIRTGKLIKPIKCSCCNLEKKCKHTMKITKNHLKLYGYVLHVIVNYINKSELKMVFSINQ